MSKLDAPINKDKVLDFAIQRLNDKFKLKLLGSEKDSIGRIAILMQNPLKRKYIVLCRNRLYKHKTASLNKIVVDNAIKKGWQLVLYVKSIDTAYEIDPSVVQIKYKDKIGIFNQQQMYESVDLDVVQAKNLNPVRRRMMNKPEKLLTSLFVEHNLPLFYIGDGSQGIKIAGKIPDWITGNKKKIVDYCGTYWHTKEDIENRTALFSKEGFDYLVIWEGEEKDIPKLLKKVKRFLAIDDSQKDLNTYHTGKGTCV